MNYYAYEDTRDVSYIKSIVIRYNEGKKHRNWAKKMRCFSGKS